MSGGKGSHEVLYIGQTAELGDRIAGHEKWPCVERNGVNAICVHTEGRQAARLEIETDLRNQHDAPCNDQ